MDTTTHPYFVPNGDSRKDTAILLVAAADDHGIDQREVRSTRTGFRVSADVADAVADSVSEGLLSLVRVGSSDAVPAEPGEYHPDFAPDLTHGERQRERVGDEAPEPDAEGEPTAADVVADPSNPVEAETPVEVVTVEETGSVHVESVPGNAEETWNPADYDIEGDDGVKTYVEENPDYAQVVLDLEAEGRNRKTLVRWLTEFIETRNNVAASE